MSTSTTTPGAQQPPASWQKPASGATSFYLPRPQVMARGALLLFVALGIFLGLQALTALPPALPTSAPATQFSAGRAMAHVETIAAQAHPVGSAEHGRVRAYLAARMAELGFPVEEHTATVAASIENMRSVASMHNLVARVPGRNPGPAVAFMAHYDSMGSTPGAADDAAGVAGLIELARALRAGAPPSRDVLLIFSDGEDQGILGAPALAADPAFAGEIGLLVNFDAAGTLGPAMLFETSGGVQPVDIYAAVTPRPVASSLATFLYTTFARIMSFATDFTPFARAGVPGWNLAMAFDRAGYHTPFDAPAHLDRQGLQHFGDTMLALARYEGELPARGSSGSSATGNPGGAAGGNAGGEAVFFNLPGLFVHYPAGWAFPAAMLAALLWSAVLALGLRHGAGLTGRGIAGGALAGLLGALAGALAASLAWAAIVAVRSDYRESALAYRGEIYLTACLALTLAAAAFVFRLFGRRGYSPANLAAGAAGIWVVLALASAAWAPGASYLFTWPLLAATIALGYLLAKTTGRGALGWAARAGSVLVTGLASAGVLVIVAPAVCLLYQFFGLSLPTAPGIPAVVVPALAAGLTFVLLLPMLELAGSSQTLEVPETSKVWGGGSPNRPGRREGGSRAWLPLASVASAAGLAIAGMALPGPGLVKTTGPTPTVTYRLDAGEGRAWFTADAGFADARVKAYFAADGVQTPVSEIMPAIANGSLLVRPAPAQTLAAPELTVLSDHVEAGKRLVRLNVRPVRGGEMVRLYFSPESGVRDVTADGVAVPPRYLTQYLQVGDWQWLILLAPPARGIDLALTARPDASLRVYVTERTVGLPALPAAPLPPAPDRGEDYTLVSRMFVLE